MNGWMQRSGPLQTQSFGTGQRGRVEAKELTTSQALRQVDAQPELRLDGLDGRGVAGTLGIGHWEPSLSSRRGDGPRDAEPGSGWTRYSNVADGS